MLPLLLAATAYAEPKLAPPWSKIVSGSSGYRKTSADCERGDYKTNRICWDHDRDRTTLYFDSLDEGQRFVKAWGEPNLEFANDEETWRTWHVRVGKRIIAASLVEKRSKVELELIAMMPLRDTIAWMKDLVGLRHSDVTKKLGVRAGHHQSVCEGILCFFDLPPNEAGESTGASVEFADGVSIKASYVMWCGRGCAMGPRILRSFDAAFGKRTTRSREYQMTGELWTYHTYASTPDLVVSSRANALDQLFVCVGQCER